MASEEQANAITHEEVEAEKREEIDWPQFFVTGEEEGPEDFVSAYWKVEGPNGPVSYRNKNSGPYPTTMIDLALEGYLSFRNVGREQTPWSDENDE